MKAIVLVVAVGCAVPVSPKEESRPESRSLQVDTLNVGLAGIGVPGESQRRPALLAELARLRGDIACLQEVWQETDKLAIRDATRASYPHAYWAKTDLSTPAAGTPETAPCAGREAELDAGVKCLAEKCATPDGRVTSLDCAVEHCLADVATLLGADDKRCYACLAAALPSERIVDIGSQCRAVGRGLGFAGQASPMLLSKHPLHLAETLVLPGCWQQRVVLRATAKLSDDSEVDVYCNHFSSIDDDPLIPYVCPHGDGTSGKTAWEAEQVLQAQALADLAAKRKGVPAIVLGDLNASPPLDLHPGYGLGTLGRLTGWTEAPLGRCTFCADNPLTDGEENGWVDHILTRDAVVTGVERTFDAAVVDLDGARVPLSDHYGVRAVVTVR